MPIFAIHYTYADDMTEALRIRPEHREWLTAQPGLLAAGMYQAGHDEFSEAPAGHGWSNLRLTLALQIRN